MAIVLIIVKRIYSYFVQIIMLLLKILVLEILIVLELIKEFDKY